MSKTKYMHRKIPAAQHIFTIIRQEKQD